MKQWAVSSGQLAVANTRFRFRNGLLWFSLLTAHCTLLTISGCQPALNRQPKVAKPDSASKFFPDGRASRPIEFGTVARGHLDDDARFVAKTGDRYVTEFPVPVTEAFVRRGQERFGIYCSQCHGRLATGNGKVVQRGYIKPPSFHTDNSRGLALRGEKIKLSGAPIGYYFDVITNGYGAMPSHGDMIPAEDRWAIIAYVRALQLRDALTPYPSPAKPGEGSKKAGGTHD